MLEEMGHPQPPTPIQMDNSTALGVVTNIIQPKCTKAMDMRLHWLCCRTNQKQFWTYWRAGSTNLANYITKHHPPIHHQTIQPLQLKPSIKRAELQCKFQGILSSWTLSTRFYDQWYLQQVQHDQHSSTNALNGYHCKGVLYMASQCHQ